MTKAGAGTVVLSGTSSYTGQTTVTGGVLRFNTSAASVPGSGANLLLNGGAAAFGYANTQTELNRIDPASTNGVFALTATSSAAFDFSALPNVSLGSTGTFTYSGAVTPSNDIYRIGGAGGALTLSSTLANGVSPRAMEFGGGLGNGGATGGSVTLTSTTNSYTGATTVRNVMINLPGGVPSGGASPLGDATSAVLLGDATTGAVTTGLVIAAGAGPTFARNILAVQAASIASDFRYRLGVQSGVTGDTTWSGGVTWGQADAVNATRRRLEFFNNSAGVLEVSGLLDNNSAAASQAQGGTLTLNGSGLGSGTIRLSNTGNSFLANQAPVTVARGTLLIGGVADVPNNSATPSVLGKGGLGNVVNLADGASRYEAVAGTYSNTPT